MPNPTRNSARMVSLHSRVPVFLDPRDLKVELIPQLNLAAYAAYGCYAPNTLFTSFKVRTNVSPVTMLFFLFFSFFFRCQVFLMTTEPRNQNRHTCSVKNRIPPHVRSIPLGRLCTSSAITTPPKVSTLLHPPSTIPSVARGTNGGQQRDPTSPIIVT